MPQLSEASIAAFTICSRRRRGDDLRTAMLQAAVGELSELTHAPEAARPAEREYFPELVRVTIVRVLSRPHAGRVLR